mmetsp:Transcript_47000/g.117216  ORF Transcript_47000/g.117216 Transcript_47000/m.117216 type:complete len:349 (-) Transcript_47000:680-1726(-)
MTQPQVVPRLRVVTLLCGLVEVFGGFFGVGHAQPSAAAEQQVADASVGTDDVLLRRTTVQRIRLQQVSRHADAALVHLSQVEERLPVSLICRPPQPLGRLHKAVFGGLCVGGELIEEDAEGRGGFDVTPAGSSLIQLGRCICVLGVHTHTGLVTHAQIVVGVGVALFSGDFEKLCCPFRVAVAALARVEQRSQVVEGTGVALFGGLVVPLIGLPEALWVVGGQTHLIRVTQIHLRLGVAHPSSPLVQLGGIQGVLREIGKPTLYESCNAVYGVRAVQVSGLFVPTPSLKHPPLLGERVDFVPDGLLDALVHPGPRVATRPGHPFSGELSLGRRAEHHVHVVGLSVRVE